MFLIDLKEYEGCQLCVCALPNYSFEFQIHSLYTLIIQIYVALHKLQIIENPKIRIH